MRSRLLPPVRRLVTSGFGGILAFIWAGAEAIWWPILPDFYLFAVAPASPPRWWRMAIAATLGSVAGGSLGFGWASGIDARAALDAAPLITPGMIEEASSWIASGGVATAVLRQPVSGVPYKVLVYLAGEAGASFGTFVGASIIARGLRIFAVCGIAALLGRGAGEQRAGRWYDLFLLAFTLAFGLGLWQVVRSFS